MFLSGLTTSFPLAYIKWLNFLFSQNFYLRAGLKLWASESIIIWKILWRLNQLIHHDIFSVGFLSSFNNFIFSKKYFYKNIHHPLSMFHKPWLT